MNCSIEKTKQTIAAVAVLAAVTLITCGCCTYRPARGPLNPNIFFNNAAQPYSVPGYAIARQPRRLDWPAARRAGGYVSAPEIITYQEYHYSDQYLTSDNKPRRRFHRQLRGFRSGQMYR